MVKRSGFCVAANGRAAHFPSLGESGCREPTPVIQATAALLEFGNFSDPQLTNGMIRPETKMPVSDRKMLNLPSAVFASRIVTELRWMLRELN